MRWLDRKFSTQKEIKKMECAVDGAPLQILKLFANVANSMTGRRTDRWMEAFILSPSLFKKKRGDNKF